MNGGIGEMGTVLRELGAVMRMGGNSNDFIGMGTVKVIPAHLYCVV